MLRHIPHALKVEALALLTHLPLLLPLPTTFRLLVYRAPGEPFMISNSTNGSFPTTCTLSQIQDRLLSILGLLWCWFLLLSVASASTMTAATPLWLLTFRWVECELVTFSSLFLLFVRRCVKKSRVVLLPLLLPLPLFGAWWCFLKWIVNVRVSCSWKQVVWIQGWHTSSTVQ